MQVRQVAEAAVLSAVAHPLRRRLLDVLRVDGPGTASTLAAATGSAVGNVSHHLKVLARAGLVEEAPELARDRRERWWRPAVDALRWSTPDFADDPAAAAAGAAAESLGLARQVELVRAWAQDPAAHAEPWGSAAFATDSWLRLSPEELAELSRELLALVDRWRDRPDDGQERVPVFLLARGFPARP